MSPVLALLYALRSQVELAISVAEAEAGVAQTPEADPNACPFCGDTEQQVTRTMLDGKTSFVRCEKCGKERPA